MTSPATLTPDANWLARLVLWEADDQTVSSLDEHRVCELHEITQLTQRLTELRQQINSAVF